MVNEKVGVEELEAVGGITKSLLDLFIDLAKEKAKKNNYHEKSGIEALIEHLKAGGKIKAHVVDSKDAKIMEACMKSSNVKYVATKTTDENGKSVVAFWYRESDESLMNEVKEKFIYEIGNGNGYINPREFVNTNINNTIYAEKGLDEVELEIILDYAKKDNFMISYIQSEVDPDKYDVIYMPKDEEKMHKALCSMAYDLSGIEGDKYRQKIKMALQNRKDFDERIKVSKNEILVIVDTENPHNFITVKEDSFTTHCIDIVKQKGVGGTVNNVLSDKNMITISSYNREELMDYVEELNNPVIMPLSEFNIIKGLSKTNEAIIGSEDEFRTNYKNIKEMLNERADKYTSKVVDGPTKISDKIYTYENIPQAAQIFIYTEIENSKLEETVFLSGNLACSDKDYPAVMNIMERALYKGLSEKERIEAKMLYEHNESLNIESESVQYIIDVNKPELVIQLESTGMSTYINGVKDSIIKSDEPDYYKILSSKVGSIQKPIVLNENEWNSPDKLEIVQKRIAHKGENKAVDYLKNYEQNEKETLYNLRPDSLLDKLNSRQKEALDKVNSYEREEIYVERNLTEKIQDETVDTKLEAEAKYRNEEIGR